MVGMCKNSGLFVGAIHFGGFVIAALMVLSLG
jgi:hypothetical protein